MDSAEMAILDGTRSQPPAALSAERDSGAHRRTLTRNEARDLRDRR
jgi:hypothetical protein